MLSNSFSHTHRLSFPIFRCLSLQTFLFLNSHGLSAELLRSKARHCQTFPFAVYKTMNELSAVLRDWWNSRSSICSKFRTQAETRSRTSTHTRVWLMHLINSFRTQFDPSQELWITRNYSKGESLFRRPKKKLQITFAGRSSTVSTFQEHCKL